MSFDKCRQSYDYHKMINVDNHMITTRIKIKNSFLSPSNFLCPFVVTSHPCPSPNSAIFCPTVLPLKEGHRNGFIKYM